MTLLSMKDDFVERTLAYVPGVWGKLDYVSGLREGGRYSHWGLARVYGEEAAQRTLGKVHSELFLQILRTRLGQLMEDLACSAAGKKTELGEFVESLVQNSLSLLPPDVAGASAVHFNSIVAALSMLAVQP